MRRYRKEVLRIVLRIKNDVKRNVYEGYLKESEGEDKKVVKSGS